MKTMETFESVIASQAEQDKIKLVRELNGTYHAVFHDKDNLKKAWDEILKICEENGINSDLIQVDKDVFEMIVSKGVVKEYFI